MTTIGVFDSGFGGLTVLRALLPLIPGAHYIYLGDTARLPYGAKSQATIARYAVESARFLQSHGADLLVIACNTATALALNDIREAVSIPVIGVIEPGAHAALASINRLRHPERSAVQSSSPAPPQIRHPERSAAQSLSPAPPQIRHPERSAAQSKDLPPSQYPLTAEPFQPQPQPEILVLATTATVQSHAYRDACARLNLHATEMPCPLLVPLVEEGWTDHAVTREVLRIYLTEALAQCTPQAVLLGCTHYPLIAAEIAATLHELGSNAIIIDSAQATAQATLKAIQITTGHLPESTAAATFECFATDSIEKFQRLGSQFLHQPITTIQLLDIGG